MSNKYEFWVSNDHGERMLLLDNFIFASYTISTAGYGTLEIGVLYDEFTAKMQPFFRPDWRIEVWRRPMPTMPLSLERIYLLRKPKVYRRSEDNVQILVFFGRDAIDLLSRRHVIQASGTAAAAKTDEIDDMMKAVVSEQMLFGSALNENELQSNTRAYPEDEFSVQADLSLGPVVTRSFADKNVLDVLKELRNTSFQLYQSDPTLYRKIYFDVVEMPIGGLIIPILAEDGQNITDESGGTQLGNILLDERSDLSSGKFGWRFQTFADLRGADRTFQLEFSVENGNLQAPWYSINHLEEINSVYIKGQGRGESRAVRNRTDTSRSNASRWNRMEGIAQATYETNLTALDAVGDLQLEEGRPEEEFYATFLDSPGDYDKPRSLYGVDWGLGDILPVRFSGILLNCEVMIVYVSIDEGGKENILGRNSVN